MRKLLFQNYKFGIVSVLLFISVTFVVPQAFGGFVPIPPTIDFIFVNPTSIDVVCTDPITPGGIITGNVLDIDDDALYGSIDVTSSGLVCDGGTFNNIDTSSLLDFKTYNVRLVVSTDSGDLTATSSFVQPDIDILMLNDVPPGLYTIQFRDIAITDDIGPSIAIPDLFPSEIGTFTVTDHNSNVDVNTPETIIVQINGVDTVLVENGDNTGIFVGPITAGDSVSYDPGTRGVARATINLEFDVVPSDLDIGLPLLTFESNEMHEDSGPTVNVFDFGETVYDDVDSSGTVTENDIRLANAATWSYGDGSLVVSGDFDDGLSLVGFASNEKHEDSGPTVNVFDFGETVYDDVDSSDTVTENDIRLANAATQGFFDGDVVVVSDGVGDIIVQDVLLTDDEITGSLGFTPVTHPFSVSFADGGMLLAGTDIDVTLSYADADLAPADNPLFIQMYYQQPGFGYDLITLSGDVDSHDTAETGKTVSSDPTTAGFCGGLCLPIEGNYVLGFDTGSGGGGGGGIAKGGFVVNALGGLKALGGSGGGNSPPSFGQSSFASITGGEEGFGGILNDNDPKTLEETKTFKVGEKAVLRFDFIEGGGIGKIEHIGLYANVRDGQKRQDSDAYIYYDPLKSPQVTVHDPNGLFSEANVDLLQKDANNFVIKYDLTFAKPMAKSDLILESWNIKKWSTINKIPSAIEVLSSGIVQEQESQPVETFLEDVTDDQVIPVWVKSNAKWWSDDKIDNDNFISGLEYLVNEGIIKVSLPEGTDNSISEVQPWIKSTAGWWADGMISEDEFITAIEWMITNNIIQVAA